jgi:DNA recombination protein RmuC
VSQEALFTMTSSIALLLGVLLGAVVGALAIYLPNRSRMNDLKKQLDGSKAESAGKDSRLLESDRQLRDSISDKAKAEQTASRIPDLEQQLSSLRVQYMDSQTKLADLSRARESDQEKIAWVEKAQLMMREAFQSLAAQSLQSNSDEFLKRTHSQLVEPLLNGVKKLDEQIQVLEQKREGAYQGVQEQLRQVASAHQQLQLTTVSLAQALKSTTVRGRWGEVQLRRVVEMADMIPHVNFDEQVSVDGGRPDMVVYLPNRGVLPVDSKAPMEAYLEAVESTDEVKRKAAFEAHGKAMKARIQELGNKNYWAQFERAPEMIVMFIPSESCLIAAFEVDPDLLEFAVKQRILVASPITLLAILKAVAFGWQQHQMAEDANQIAQQGQELYERFLRLSSLLVNLGKRIDATVIGYNEVVGSFDSRAIPAARRLKEMSAGRGEIPEVSQVDRATRAPALLEADPRDEDENPEQQHP